MLKTQNLPNCHYSNNYCLILPKTPTPNHTLYLSNLDDQSFLRFSIKYVYVFKKCPNIANLKLSLSRALVEYYPLAGRLRMSRENDHKLEIDCNGEGAVFAEGIMDISVEEFLEQSCYPNASWRKLLHKVEVKSFLDVPPLVIQVTRMRCGGMILCTAISHCLSDGIGTSQFLHDWAHFTTNSTTELEITPFHNRDVLKPRSPPQITFAHPQFYKSTLIDINMNSQHVFERLVPSSLTFTSAQIINLKRQCVPSLKCTNFEVLATHTWRSWAKSLDLDHATHVKLLFSMNFRNKVSPKMPQGYYGNGFVLGCAEVHVKDLFDANLHCGVKLVQQAKSILTDEYVRSVVDLLEDKTVKTELSRSLVITQWSNLGLEDLDFGEGKPLHMGPLTSDIYCLFLPVIGENEAIRVLVSMPENSVGRYEYYMRDISDMKQNGYHDGYKMDITTDYFHPRTEKCM